MSRTATLAVMVGLLVARRAAAQTTWHRAGEWRFERTVNRMTDDTTTWLADARVAGAIEWKCQKGRLSVTATIPADKAAAISTGPLWFRVRIDSEPAPHAAAWQRQAMVYSLHQWSMPPGLVAAFTASATRGRVLLLQISGYPDILTFELAGFARLYRLMGCQP